MNKPGNMPVDKWSKPLYGLSAIPFTMAAFAGCAGATFRCNLLVNIGTGLARLASAMILSAAMLIHRHHRRVRKYLALVCCLCLLACAGCVDPSKLAATRGDIEPIKKQLDRIERRLHGPTQVLPGPSEELLPEPQPAKPERCK